MAEIQTERKPATMTPSSAYLTSYNRDFEFTAGVSAQAERPRTSRAFQPSYKLAGPIGNSSYQVEYRKRRTDEDGANQPNNVFDHKRNNPHPSEAFMNWRIRKTELTDRKYTNEEMAMTDSLMDEVCRGQLKSTYQNDYLGNPQNYDVRSAFSGLPEDWRAKVPYSLDSVMRHSYQIPKEQEEFVGNRSRYGCNRNKKTTMSGSFPSCPDRRRGLLTRTTYQREYNQTPANDENVKDVCTMGKTLVADSLKSHARKTPDKIDDKDALEMLNAMSVNDKNKVQDQQRSKVVNFDIGTDDYEFSSEKGSDKTDGNASNNSNVKTYRASLLHHRTPLAAF